MKGRVRFVLQEVNELIAKLGIRSLCLKGTESGRGVGAYKRGQKRQAMKR